MSLILHHFRHIITYFQKRKDITFGNNLSVMNWYTESIITQHLKCLVSPTSKIWQTATFKKTGHVTILYALRVVCHAKASIWSIRYLHTKFRDSRFSYSGPRDMTAGIKITNGSCDPTTPILGVVMTRLGFEAFYLCAKFDDSSSNRSSYIIWGLKM